MASLVKDLIEAGIHFGHRANNWNPKMAPYIYGKRNKIHIIDVKETIKGLLLARKFISKTVATGKDILFVGTKRQARACIEKHVSDAAMPYVTERWLGGTLTNFRTIRERLKRLEELEGLEESGAIDNYSKKMESALRREKEKILRNLEGIRNMTNLPGALVIVDVMREVNAVREARKLGIPVVALIDTDSDPDLVDIAIPGNDDAMRAIEVVLQSLTAAVNEGKSGRISHKQGEEQPEKAAEPRRRSRRAQFRAEVERAAEEAAKEDPKPSSPIAPAEAPKAKREDDPPSTEQAAEADSSESADSEAVATTSNETKSE